MSTRRGRLSADCRQLLLLMAVCALTGCAVVDRSREIATAARWQQQDVRGGEFMLRSYLQRGTEAEDQVLHVYLGGDGSPWLAGRFPAPDPGPENPLTLELMRLDPGPALYLGRPCYHGLARSPGCTPELWTFARYSPQVVDAMLAALEALLSALQPRSVLLIGYSGGGVLALALAARLPVPGFVVTLGGNLDVQAWTDYHGYLPLDGSLNPAEDPARFAPLPQLHLQGQRDRVVPPQTTARYLSALPADAVRRLAQADHRCCWQSAWQQLLHEQPWAATLGAANR